MNRQTAHSAREMQRIAGILANLPEESYPVEVVWQSPRKDRSLDQNAISHVWYAQVAREEKEYTPEEVKRRCKYHLGIPILRENPEYSQMIEKVLGPLSYEERLRAMDLINVTSVLSKPQMSAYLEHMQAHYAGRVRLEFPE